VSPALIIVTLLSAVLGAGCLVGGLWLLRTLRWEVVDDDQLSERIGHGSALRPGWLTDWIKPKTPMLTYRRDERGRFRRYRR
jgi:hypothetical protein